MKITVKCREVLSRATPVSQGVDQIVSAASFDSGNRTSKNAQGQDVAITPEVQLTWNTLPGRLFTEGLEYELEINEKKEAPR